MAIKELTVPIWVGWLSGVLVLKRPWGSPTLPSWFTFSTFYCLFGLIMYFILMTDFTVNNIGGFALGEEDQFAKYVRGFAVFQYVIVTLLKRITFLKNAKRLGILLETLTVYEHTEASQQRKKGKEGGWRKWTLPVLFTLTFTLTFASIVLKSIGFIRENAHKPSWVKMVGLGTLGYSILYSLFAVLPLGVVSNVAYAVIMVTSLKVTQIYCDFCNSVKDSLGKTIGREGCNEMCRDKSNLEIYTILKMGPRADWRKKKSVCSVTCSGSNKIQPYNPVNSHVLTSRQQIIQKFEEVKELMSQTNNVLSPFLLWMMCGMTLGLVTNASQLFVGGPIYGLNLIGDIFIIPLFAIYGLLLELGHRIGRRQKAVKLELQRKFLNMAWSMGKDEMEDVIHEILDWEWKLSACDFFFVDRGLASGIFTLVLNYVVILVQLNIALQDAAPICLPSNSTNMTYPERI